VVRPSAFRPSAKGGSRLTDSEALVRRQPPEDTPDPIMHHMTAISYRACALLRVLNA